MQPARPSDIDRDFVLRYASRGELFRETEGEYRYVSPLLLILPGLPVPAAVAGLAAVRRGRRARR